MALTKAQKMKRYNLRAKLESFWDYCKDNAYIPDIETLCLHLDTNRQRLWEMETSEDYKEISDIIKNVKNRIFHEQKQLALRGKLNSAIFIFNAVNNFGYVQKVEHEHSSNTNITVTFNVPKIQTNMPIKTLTGEVIQQQATLQAGDTNTQGQGHT